MKRLHPAPPRTAQYGLRSKRKENNGRKTTVGFIQKTNEPEIEEKQVFHSRQSVETVSNALSQLTRKQLAQNLSTITLRENERQGRVFRKIEQVESGTVKPRRVESSTFLTGVDVAEPIREERIVENVTAEELILEKKRQRWPNVQPTIKFGKEDIKEEIEEEPPPPIVEQFEVEEQIEEAPKHTEIIERNIQEVRQFVSHARRQLIEEKKREREERAQQVWNRKAEIEQLEEKTLLEKKQADEEKRKQRDHELLMLPFYQRWFTMIEIAKRMNLFIHAYENQDWGIVASLNARRDSRIVPMIPEEADEQVQQRFVELNSENIQRLRVLLAPGLASWKQKRTDRMGKLLVKFLLDLNDSLRIPLAVRKYKKSVLVIQHLFRQYRARTVARLAYMKLHFDKYFSRRVDYVESTVAGLFKKYERDKNRRDKIIKMKKRGESLDHGVGYSEQDEQFFKLLAEREELRKISSGEVNIIDHIRNLLKQRLKMHIKEMDNYKKLVASGRNVNQLSKPRLSLGLKKAEIKKIANDGRAAARVLLRKTLQEKEKKEKL